MEEQGLSWEAFYKDFGEALVHGSAAVFAGAGLSVAAGYVDWRGLLRDFAEELGLDLEQETDLVSVAQYHLNAEGGVRSRLNQKIVDTFSAFRDLTPAHQTLARLPITTYWTTNYDALIERGVEEAGKTPEVKSAAQSLTITDRRSDVVVHKLHGDLSDAGNIVITRDDYEEYVEKRSDFREALRNDLTRLTFVFIGFSFTDPHLDFILSELRRVHRKAPRTHYVITRREAREDYSDDTRYRYATTRQAHRIRDLKRYGLQTVLIDNYSEVGELLEGLRTRYLRRQVFVSGAAADFDPKGREWVSELGKALGGRLIEQGYNVVSGFGLGVGSPIVLGALEQLYATQNPRVDKRLLLRPFPQPASDDEDVASLFSEYRASMLAIAGFAIFIAGNRTASNGTLEISPGVEEESRIAQENGAYLLPVGTTGWAAEKLWNRMNADLGSYFPEPDDIRSGWQTLNAPSASPTDVVDALVAIMNTLRPT